MKYLTMKQRFKIYQERFDSPKAPESMRQKFERRQHECGVAMKKRGGYWTLTRRELNKLMDHLEAHPSAIRAMTVKAAKTNKRQPFKRIYRDIKPPPHRQPWSWTEKVYKPAKGIR